MKYSAEIFDLVQYLFETTGFNDHQLHCVIHFKSKVDAAAMEKAFRLLLSAVPMLSRVYRDRGGNSFWEDGGEPYDRSLFTAVGSAADFDRFTTSRTNAETGPQIKGCLFQGERDALSIVANHMVADGAGFKECVYLLSRLYSGIIENPLYKPDFIADGDRGYKKILSGLTPGARLRILLTRGGDNNASGAHTFPLPGGDQSEPFICTRALNPQTYRAIAGFGKECGATVNDVILTAYFRVLSEILALNGAPLSLPLMIDMRRYAEGNSFDAPANYASTEILSVAVRPGEAFTETLARLSALTKAKKTDDFGLNSFIKLQTLFLLFGRKKAFGLLRWGLRNPKICVTNIGIVDDRRLVFAGAEIENAIVTGSIKYRPHFQMSLSTWRDQMTLAVNLYGSREDREKISGFFDLMDRELEALHR